MTKTLDEIKPEEYLEKIKKNGFLEELTGHGTKRETQTWITEQIAELVLLGEEAAVLKGKMEKHEQKLEELIWTVPEIKKHREKIDGYRLKLKSINVRIESKWDMVYNLIKAKITDLLEREFDVEMDEEQGEDK